MLIRCLSSVDVSLAKYISRPLLFTTRTSWRFSTRLSSLSCIPQTKYIILVSREYAFMTASIVLCRSRVGLLTEKIARQRHGNEFSTVRRRPIKRCSHRMRCVQLRCRAAPRIALPCHVRCESHKSVDKVEKTQFYLHTTSI